MTDPVVKALSDHPNPSVRVLARVKLGDGSTAADCLREDHALVPQYPPARNILEAQYPDGYWMHPGLGISPHYRATIWQVLFLAQLGLGAVPAVRRAVHVVLRDNVDEAGAAHLRQGEGGRSLALTGALLWAAAVLDVAAATGGQQAGAWDHAWSWVWRQVSGGVISASAAVWLARAFAAWREKSSMLPGPSSMRDALAVALGEVPFSQLDGALTFPLTLQVDALAWMEAWVALEQPDRIPSGALVALMDRRLPSGYWPLERAPEPIWCDLGELNEPNPWVTIRALTVVLACAGAVG
jgi:hypothetical protein